MLVRLTNTGLGQRVVYAKHNNLPRTINPGQSADVDLPTLQIERFATAFDKGDTLSIDLLGGDLDDHKLKEIEEARKQAANGEPQPEPLISFTWAQPREVRPSQDRAEIARPDRMPPPPPAPEPMSLPELANRITAAARQAAKPPEPEPEKKPEPSTPAELLNRSEEFGEADFRRLANKVLAERALPGRPKKSQIMEALKQAQNLGDD